MNFSDFFSFSYLFSTNPGTDFLWGFPLLGLFLVCLFISTILQNPAKKNKYLKKSLRKKLWPFKILGGLGIVFVLARFAGMETLSRPIFLVLTTFITIIFAGFTIYRVRKEFLLRIKSAEREKLKRTNL